MASFDANAGRILALRDDGSTMIDTNHRMPAQNGSASLTGQTLTCTNPHAYMQTSGSQKRWHQDASDYVVDHDLGVAADNVPTDYVMAMMRITHVDADWWNATNFGDPVPSESMLPAIYRGGFTAWYTVGFYNQYTLIRWFPVLGSIWVGYVKISNGALLGNRSLTLIVGANGNWHLRQRDVLKAYNSSYSTPGGLVFGWQSLDVIYTFDLKLSWGVVDG